MKFHSYLSDMKLVAHLFVMKFHAHLLDMKRVAHLCVMKFHAHLLDMKGVAHLFRILRLNLIRIHGDPDL
jgi:hypothetical protein